MRSLIFVAGLSVNAGSFGQAVDQAEGQTEPPRGYEEVTIIGTREEATEISGSAHVIGTEELERFLYSDVQRIARQVPGISIQVEDGYGLRPNISIRGVATERSGRITLLEDNVLIAPAPYSAPSAYYFPTPGRISSFEVLKGPAAIRQGPYTIGGALNMVSTPFSQDAGGAILAEAGSNSTFRVHGHYGWSPTPGVDLLFETHQWQSDGFQSIDRSSQDAGLDVSDYMFKARFAPLDSRHGFELKLQLAEQASNQSYLGLTDADFDRDPLRRYGISELDNIETEHEQVMLRYTFDYSDNLRFSATAYNNQHERNWFKTEGFDPDGSNDAQDFNRTSWANVVAAINEGGSVGDLSASDLQAVLDGTLDTANGSIQVRSNAREYYSRGVQVAMNWDAEFAGVTHDIEIGLRYHEDEEDRLQRNSNYNQSGGTLILNDLGLLGNAGNRIQQAEAWALHVFDTINLGGLRLTPGFRFESIDQSRVRYEIRNGQTIDPASRSDANLRSTRSNSTNVFLPGFGATYQLTDALSVIGGVHKGFTAPSNSPGVEEETAINLEFGVRYQSERLRVDAIGFVSDYENLLGVCTASSGSDCEVGDAFNGDAATVKGLELVVDAELWSSASAAVPLRLTYTYLDGQFDTNIADTDFFGDVSSGDPIPYIPDHQLALQIGYQSPTWDVFGSVNYVDGTCVRASCGTFERTDSTVTLDVTSQYRLNERLGLFLRLENLTDELAIVGRQPYGARPNHDRSATLGFRISL